MGRPLYKDATDTANGPSPSIWADFDSQSIVDDPTKCTHVFERFLQPPCLVTPTITTQAVYGNGLKAFGDTGSTILSGSNTGGSLVLLTDGTDNDAVSVAQIALPFTITQGTGSLWFEAMFKTSTIAANTFAIFCGLYEQQTLTTILPIVAAGTMADANFVGFLKAEGAATVNAAYKANGVTAVTIKASAKTLVADTYTKMGFKYDDNSKVFRMYVDGAQVGSDYSLASAAGTDFPNDVNLGFCFAMHNASSSSNLDTCTLRWYRVAQNIV